MLCETPSQPKENQMSRNDDLRVPPTGSDLGETNEHKHYSSMQNQNPSVFAAIQETLSAEDEYSMNKSHSKCSQKSEPKARYFGGDVNQLSVREDLESIED